MVYIEVPASVSYVMYFETKFSKTGYHLKSRLTKEWEFLEVKGERAISATVIHISCDVTIFFFLSEFGEQILMKDCEVQK